jgi:hypothetical protein
MKLSIKQLALREYYQEVFQEWISLDNNLQNVFTAYVLCEQMINKICKYCKLKDKKILVTNLEFAIILIEHGVNPEDICFLTDCDKKAKFGKDILGVKIMKDDFDDFLDNLWEDKWDVCIMNPPWNRKKHLQFIRMLPEIAKDIAVSVQPAGWILCERKDKKTVEALDGHIKEIEIFDSQKDFNIEIGCLTGIFVVDPNKKNKSITIDDKFNNKKTECGSVWDLNIYSDYKMFPQIKEKIKNTATKNGSLFDHVDSGSGYFVNIAKIRGHGGNADLHTFIPKNQKIENKPRMQYFGFETENEAINFISYLKGYPARFALSILKSNKNMHQGELKYVPWMNFNNNYTENDIYKEWNLNEDEISFIEKILPKYY